MFIGKIFPVFVEFLPIRGATLFMERLRRCTWKIKEDICVVAKFLKIPSILPYVVLCEIFFVTHCTIISWEMCDRALVRKFLTLNYSVALATFFVMFNIVVCNFVNFAGNDIQRPTRSHWKQRQVPMTTTQVEC